MVRVLARPLIRDILAQEGSPSTGCIQSYLNPTSGLEARYIADLFNACVLWSANIVYRPGLRSSMEERAFAWFSYKEGGGSMSLLRYLYGDVC